MTVLAMTEQRDGVFRKSTYEVLSEGRRIADALGCDLTALVLGSTVEAAAPELQRFGADRIMVADHESLSEYAADAYTNVMAETAQKENPAVIILAATATGKDFAPRLSARLDAPLANDCVSTSTENGKLIATRYIYGGKLLAEVEFEASPQMVALRPNACDIVEKGGRGDVEKVEVAPADTSIRFMEKAMETGKKELTEADVIVSGGRGMGGSDYTVIEELAEVLGGAVGASRSAVDEGWRPHSDQVGQTGKIVSPNLYIACGISGAIQHLAGMSSSKVIVAVNKDEEAPIFSKADYGIVGDLFQVIPSLTEEIRKYK